MAKFSTTRTLDGFHIINLGEHERHELRRRMELMMLDALMKEIRNQLENLPKDGKLIISAPELVSRQDHASLGTEISMEIDIDVMHGKQVRHSEFFTETRYDINPKSVDPFVTHLDGEISLSEITEERKVDHFNFSFLEPNRTISNSSASASATFFTRT